MNGINRKELVMTAVVAAISVMLVSSILTVYTVEAKSKKFEIKVYVKNIETIGHNILDLAKPII